MLSRKQKRAERKERRESRRVNQRPNSNVYDINPQQHGDSRPVNIRGKLVPKNAEQKSVLNAIENSTITVVSGKVGSGKTFLAAAKAAEMLLDPSSPIEGIVLVRPPEPLGRSVGLLPGTKEEKMLPYLIPILDGLEYMVGKVGVERLIAQDKIEYVLVEHLRGRTFNNKFVIFDEVNNLSERATAVSLLRTGKNCKMVYCGDVRQSDVSKSGMSLFDLLQEEYENTPFMYRELTECVRSDEASAFAYMFDSLNIEY